MFQKKVIGTPYSASLPTTIRRLEGHRNFTALSDMLMIRLKYQSGILNDVDRKCCGKLGIPNDSATFFSVVLPKI